MGTLEVAASSQSCLRMILFLVPLACLLLARSALAGQCIVSGDCVITGTVNGEWNDDWGCDNVNACWDEAACCDRLNGNWEYCQNGANNHMCTTFTAITVEPPVMDQTAVVTQIVPTQTRTCSQEPWLVGREKQMTTTTMRGTTL